MALETFFEINLPYFVERHKTKKDYWVCSNREYRLIGTTNDVFRISEIPDDYYVRYKGLDEKAILKIADGNHDSIRRNDEGEITRFYLHNCIHENFSGYLKRLEMLFKYKNR